MPMIGFICAYNCCSFKMCVSVVVVVVVVFFCSRYSLYNYLSMARD